MMFPDVIEGEIIGWCEVRLTGGRTKVRRYGPTGEHHVLTMCDEVWVHLRTPYGELFFRVAGATGPGTAFRTPDRSRTFPLELYR